MEDQVISKHGLNFVLRDFSQRQYEQYQYATTKAARDNYFSFEVKSGAGITAEAIVRGAVVRAAINSEILTGVDLSAVDQLNPGVVHWLAGLILKHVRDVTSPPPDPN